MDVTVKQKQVKTRRKTDLSYKCKTSLQNDSVF